MGGERFALGTAWLLVILAFFVDGETQSGTAALRVAETRDFKQVQQVVMLPC